MSQLEASKVLVAEVIAFLEPHGVVPAWLHVSDFRSNYSSDDVKVFSSVISWLSAESVIRHRHDPTPDDTDETLHYNVVLTSFGFFTLERQLSGNLTLRDQLREARQGKRNWSSVGDLLGGVLGGFTKTIGNG